MFRFPEGTQSSVGRCVSAEVRARMAAQRISGKSLAARIGVSQNYLAIRLRDEKPFTLDDIEVIADELGADDIGEFVLDAERRHGDAVFAAYQQAAFDAIPVVDDEGDGVVAERVDLGLAASTHDLSRETPDQDEPA